MLVALGKIVPELNISHATYYGSKQRFSMFTPELQTALKSNSPNVDSVVLFGIESHVCILQTALDLLDQNMRVYVPVDAVSSMHYGEVNMALNRLSKEGAILTSSESILFQLLQTADHGCFKEISKLCVENKSKKTMAYENMVSKLRF